MNNRIAKTRPILLAVGLLVLIGLSSIGLSSALLIVKTGVAHAQGDTFSGTITAEPPDYYPMVTENAAGPMVVLNTLSIDQTALAAKVGTSAAVAASGSTLAEIAGTARTARICSSGSVCAGLNWIQPTVAHIAGSGLYNIAFNFAFRDVPNCQVTPEATPGQTVWASIVASPANGTQSSNSIMVQTTQPGLLGIGATPVDAAFRLTCDHDQ